MRLGLRGKLLGVTLGLLALLTAGALLTVRHYFGQQLQQQAGRELLAGTRVLAAIFERSSQQLLDRGRLLAELPSLQEALTTSPQRAEPLLLEVKAIRAANLLWATDAQGTVVASTGESPPPGTLLARDPLIAAALRGQEALGFDVAAGEWWLVLSLPVARDGVNTPLGTVTLALLIGEAYMARLSELMKCQVGFLWGRHALWSDQWPEPLRHRVAARLVEGLSGTPRELRGFQEGRYLWVARPVTGGTPPIVAGPIALLGLRVDESVIQHTTRGIIGIAGLTMLIGALLSIWAIRSITRPLKVLVEDSQRIGAGDLAHRSRLHGTDEIGELAGSFNQMVERLQASYNELAEFNRTLEQRVQERSRQLEQAQAQLLQSEKLASIGQLAAGVAHELNNPLMVVMGNIQLVQRLLAREPAIPDLRKAELQEILTALDQEAHRAKTIVANLLDFSRMKPPAQTTADLHTLLDESMRLVAHQASLQEVQVDKRYGPEVPWVTADPNKLKQVFINVILNAVQAMPTGGRLTLETSTIPTHATVVIQDTGVGIPEEHLSKVFDPFFTTKEVGKGTGLGLSVSYGIVQQYGGTIDVTSHLGKGTTVTIQLPRTPGP